MTKNLTHHDLFALCGYATTLANKVLSANDDIIYHVGIEICLESGETGTGSHLSLSSHYQRPTVDKFVKAAGDMLSDRWSIMPLQRIVRTRDEIDASFKNLVTACDEIRDLMSTHTLVNESVAKLVSKS